MRFQLFIKGFLKSNIHNFRYINRKYFIRKIWWEKELIVFIWIIVKYSTLKEKEFKQFSLQDWTFISSILPLKTAEECQLKLLGLEKVSLQKIPWSQQEDQTLKKIIWLFLKI